MNVSIFAAMVSTRSVINAGTSVDFPHEGGTLVAVAQLSASIAVRVNGRRCRGR